MRLLPVLLLAIFSVLLNAAPTPDVPDCLEEIKKARECAKIAPDRFKLVPASKFEEKEKKIAEFHNCLGPLKCEITEVVINMENRKIALVKLLSNLYDCLQSNDNYDEAKDSCRSWFSGKSCTYGPYFRCIAEKLAKKPECTTENVDEFRNLKGSFEEACEKNVKVCKAFSGYGKKQLI